MTSRKMQCRRRLAALAFLSNISLDGTHGDTRLRHLVVDHPHPKRSPHRGHEPSRRRSTEDRPTRVHKLVSDAKARLYNLSQKRRLPKSLESCSFPADRSTESLGAIYGGCRSRQASLCLSECPLPMAPEIKFLHNLNDHKNEAERMVILSEKKYPMVLFSVLPHRRSSKCESRLLEGSGRRCRHASSRQLSIIADDHHPLDLLTLLGVERPKEGQDISYGQLLYPSYLQESKSGGEISWFPYHALHAVPDHLLNDSCLSYHPDLLDDPHLIAGKHSTLLFFPSYITSVMDYVKPSELKKDLNDKFQEKFPHVQLTLSKLRSLKREMYKIAKVECNIDLSVVAQAFVYFEKLVLKVLVNKQNRKLCAGACLLLSAKLNDTHRPDLQKLLERIECVFRVHRRDVVCLEFGVLVALEFSLLLSARDILPHYQRLLYQA